MKHTLLEVELLCKNFCTFHFERKYHVDLKSLGLFMFTYLFTPQCVVALYLKLLPPVCIHKCFTFVNLTGKNVLILNSWIMTFLDNCISLSLNCILISFANVPIDFHSYQVVNFRVFKNNYCISKCLFYYFTNFV